MLFCYIDDWIVLGLSKSEALKHTSMLVYLFRSLGFEINFPKLELNPAQRLIWIGLEVDLWKGLITLPGDKMVTILKDLDRLRRASMASIHRCTLLLI